jgi:hypothetical protein
VSRGTISQIVFAKMEKLQKVNIILGQILFRA